MTAAERHSLLIAKIRDKIADLRTRSVKGPPGESVLEENVRRWALHDIANELQRDLLQEHEPLPAKLRKIMPREGEKPEDE